VEPDLRAGRGRALNPADFVRANTALLPVPLVPEIVLHLASEALPLWQKTEEELAAAGLPPPYWAFAWAGGQALARHLLDHAALVAGKRVLDLGSGSGLAGIAAMKAGAAQVSAVDIDAFAIAAIELNGQANHVSIEAIQNDMLGARGAAGAVILVGDLFYEKPFAERVLAFLEAQAKHGADVLLGDPGRSYLPRDRFEPVATYAVPVSRDLEDGEIKNTSVWRFKPT
jgi:predicted nicotinamide N-methyase